VNPPLPTAPSLQELGGWKVLTPLDIAEGIRQQDPALAAALIGYYAKYPSAAFTLYAVSPEQYAIIINNQTETLRYVRDLRAVVDYYRGLDLK